MKKLNLLSILLVMLGSSSIWGADTTSTPAPAIDPEYTRAQQMVQRKEWAPAAQVLEAFIRANPRSADGFNLLGYSYRNLQRMDEALAAYNQALKLEPKHKGAHEYIGIAFIQLGQLAKAREHLVALDNICTFSCEEYRDLKKAYEEASKTKFK
jgi:cytochrome c-type biogenesis protein CcmH/NrfG